MLGQIQSGRQKKDTIKCLLCIYFIFHALKVYTFDTCCTFDALKTLKEEVQHFGNNGPKCGFMLTELTSLYDFCAF